VRPRSTSGPLAGSWWRVESTQNEKAVSYVCPLCDERLEAASAHMLLLPAGDASRRRHAHTRCVAEARSAGQLPSEQEWRASRGGQPPDGRRRRRA
jgi:hypothetical protein